jgi:hypothetical protein
MALADRPLRDVLRIGVDFDNTIACYDTAFHAAALERELFDEIVAPTKGAVRDYLRRTQREDAWTELQGYIYGARMTLAALFPGLVEFLKVARERGVEIHIISHKTLHPYLGPKYDLHAAARGFLCEKGICEALVPSERVHFELTLQEKLARIATLQCNHFIDDLPELLAEQNFPAGVGKLLFDPNKQYPADPGYERFEGWGEIAERLLRVDA